MKTLIVYNSRYGSTKEYSIELARMLKCDVLPLRNIAKANLDNYNVIVFSSYFYLGKLMKIDFVKKVWEKIKSKKVIVLGVSAFASKKNIIEKQWIDSISTRYRENIAFFVLHGRIRRKRLSIFDKIILFFTKKGSFDRVDLDNLKEVYKYIKVSNN